MSRKARELKEQAVYYVQCYARQTEVLFENSFDYEFYLDLMVRYRQKHSVCLYGFCLLPREVHLIVYPKAAKSLAKFMQGLNQAYSKHKRKQDSNIIKIWKGRFKSKALESALELHDHIKSLEIMPVRERISEYISDYRWSSYIYRVDK